MSKLALVDVEAGTARRLEALGEVHHFSAATEMEAALSIVCDGLDVVVVGRDVSEPIQVVQRTHRMGPAIGVVLLTANAPRCARVTDALRTAPFVGADVVCVDLERTDPVVEVRLAAARAQNRRSQRALYADLNARIVEGSSTDASRAEVTASILLDFAPIGIVSLDAQQRIASANREASRLLGAREIDLLGRALGVGVPESGVALVPLGGDHDRLVEVRAAKVASSTLSFVTLADVTARVHAEAASETARRALETTLRSIGDAVITTDTEGRVTMMNPVAEQLTGWPEGEARGRALEEVFRILDENTRAPVESPVAKVLRDGAVVSLANHTLLVSRDGVEHPIDDSAAPIRDAGHDIHGVVLVFRSVSGQKRRALRGAIAGEAIAALNATLDFHQALSALAGILVPRFADFSVIDLVGEDGQPELVALAHRDPAKAERGRTLRRANPPRDPDPLSVSAVLRTGKSVFVPELTRKTLSDLGVDEGRIRAVETVGLRSAIVVPLVGRESVFGAITVAYADSGRTYTEEDREFLDDFSRRIAAAVDNARLFAAEQRARAAADVANRAKDEFLATVSHELRTPLNAILGWSRMVVGGRMEPERQRAGLEAIERNATAMAQLINDLLDVSRIASGKLRLEPEWIDPAAAVASAIDSMRPAAVAKEIELRTSLDPRAGPILVDATRLQQIVWNLVSNAVKFTPRGGRVEIALHRADSSVELLIADGGIGISREFLPHVFDPFRQADASPTRTHGGLGLGLAITRHLVELHGGRIEAHSEGEGRGATFLVVLPIAPRNADAFRDSRASHDDLARARPVPSLSGVRVLAVDDDADARELVRQSLELAGASVDTAPSAAAALEKFQQKVPDVLVCDIGMPGEDGCTLIAKVRKLPLESGGAVPAAALTAYTRPEDRRKILDAGFTLHLAKPIDPSELVAVVATLSALSRRD